MREAEAGAVNNENARMIETTTNIKTYGGHNTCL